MTTSISHLAETLDFSFSEFLVYFRRLLQQVRSGEERKYQFGRRNSIFHELTRGAEEIQTRQWGHQTVPFHKISSFLPTSGLTDLIELSAAGPSFLLLSWNSSHID